MWRRRKNACRRMVAVARYAHIGNCAKKQILSARERIFACMRICAVIGTEAPDGAQRTHSTVIVQMSS